MYQTTQEPSVPSIRAALVSQAFELIIQERHTRVEAQRLFISANRLNIQSLRLRMAALEQQHLARILAKDESQSTDDVQSLHKQALAMLQKADSLHEQALQKITQAMRLRARLFYK